MLPRTIGNDGFYRHDYTETKNRICSAVFRLVTGEELWQRGYTVRLKRNHGLSRTIPAVTDKYVVTMRSRCQVMCVLTGLRAICSGGFDLAIEYAPKYPSGALANALWWIMIQP
ncbi:MAG: hypothetical protein U0Z17_01230 [Bacteroidales bacterium]